LKLAAYRAVARDFAGYGDLVCLTPHAVENPLPDSAITGAIRRRRRKRGSL